MTEERSSSTLPLMASVGLAWFAPDYTLKRVRLPPLSFPFCQHAIACLAGQRFSAGRRALSEAAEVCSVCGPRARDGLLALPGVLGARRAPCGHAAPGSSSLPQRRRFPGAPGGPGSAKNGPRRPGNGKYCEGVVRAAGVAMPNSQSQLAVGLALVRFSPPSLPGGSCALWPGSWRHIAPGIAGQTCESNLPCVRTGAQTRQSTGGIFS